VPNQSLGMAQSSVLVEQRAKMRIGVPSRASKCPRLPQPNSFNGVKGELVWIVHLPPHDLRIDLLAKRISSLCRRQPRRLAQQARQRR
jgi:hypothetical protein